VKLTRKQAEELGIKVEPAKRNKAKINKVSPAVFDAMCRSHGIPLPKHEFVFHPSRKWRFDYFWSVDAGGFGLDSGIALEVNGGTWIEGRHNTGTGSAGDREKMNAAACMGYRVLYATPQEVESGEAFALVKKALCYDGGLP
jgi:hypothetical protein